MDSAASDPAKERNPQRRGLRSRRLALFLIAAGMGVAASGHRGLVADAADPEQGRATFMDKQCIRCHAADGTQATGPALSNLRRPQGEMELAGRLWNHVPAMFSMITQERLEWPRISVGEMADLMAYLQADRARDPEPDLAKGQMTLLRKGCLKCHSLKREGGQVKPDLAQPGSAYESGVAWTAAMWTHTPGMASMASRQGIPYPRFSGDEMGNLLGFLRHAAETVPPGSKAAPSR
jgi:cytochrome c2